MRQHLRLLVFCCVAAFTAGCSDTNKTNLTDNSLSPNLAPCASIGDRVWVDSNCDGIQDGGEPGYPGATVELYVCGGGLVGSTTTDASGNYLFSNLDDALDYRVHFVLPGGFTFAPANQGGVEANDSDAGVDGFTSCADVQSCKAPRYYDAGLCVVEEKPCATIGDRVFVDENCNGLQDKLPDESPELGLPGVEVSLYTCEGQLVDTDVTDVNGDYLFEDVDDALSYRVCFLLPDGYEWSPKDQGGNDGIDSDVNADGCTDCFTLDECEDDRTRDAGVCREDGGEGCTPGFWKNHYTHWALTGYSPEDIFDDVFGCEIFGDDTTLGEAVHVEWTHNVLAFHGVAALLNAAHPDVDFDYSESEVKDLVCDGDKDALADANEEGCPLSGGNTTGGGKNGTN
jgi:hypothetical protein